MDKVFWMNLHAKAGSSLEDKFKALLKQAALDSIVRRSEIVAVKVHVGERGNLGYVNHNYARLAVTAIKNCGGKPFLTDTNTLYSGGRHNGVDHADTACMHGYFSGTTGAPFLPADGLRGLDYEEIPVMGRHFTKARIAGALCQADQLVMLTHFKGHGEMGFGGTIKNMGMGCAAVPGKLELHSSSHPVLTQKKCVGCAQCFRRCPVHAITMKSSKATIDHAICIGCGQCVAACNFGAMGVAWGEHGASLIEKISEYASAIYKRYAGKALYLNFAMMISPDCDCWDFNDLPMVQDIGIFASLNPLSLDRATLDMVNKSPALPGSSYVSTTENGGNIFDARWTGVKSDYVFEYCRKLGMEDEYKLVQIE
jgi:uncharacterized Fe-S center protein